MIVSEMSGKCKTKYLSYHSSMGSRRGCNSDSFDEPIT